jgi:predicted metalloprotease with PDZ domain
VARPQERALTVARISYRLAMPEPHTHLFEVEMRLPGGGPVELVMPSWTPGSYLMREFARHVQDFSAEAAGAPVRWEKRNKSTWRVHAPEGELLVRYRVYANEPSVRTSHLDASHGYVNGASVFLFARGYEGDPVSLEIEAPRGWRATTSMDAEGPFRFTARDYDELVDSPIEIGEHELLEWEQEGIPHRYAIWGRGNYDPERLVADTRRIIAAESEMFGGLPYARYTFILHLLPEGRGGLEHAASSSLQAGRWAFEGEPYEDFLALVAHEFFHVWNAKRIRPEPLGPFDYTRENYTRDLWVVEGLTTYYTDLMLRRAGIITEERYLARLAESISRMQSLPGRRHQTLEASSFDTWIRFYRPDEHTPNAQVSYYQKGALVGLLLDLEIREASGGRHSLDDLMRTLWERYGSRDVGYPEEMKAGVQAIAEELAGRSLDDFFAAYIWGTEELDHDRYLAAAGLTLTREPAPDESGTGNGEKGARPSDAAVIESRLGARVRETNGRLLIANVLEGGAGWNAGLNAGDELLALDGLRVASTAALAARLRELHDGDLAQVALFRRDELTTVPVPAGPAAAPPLRIAPRPDATAEEAALRKDWLRGAAGG